MEKRDQYGGFTAPSSVTYYITGADAFETIVERIQTIDGINVNHLSPPLEDRRIKCYKNGVAVRSSEETTAENIPFTYLHIEDPSNGAAR